LPPPTILRVRTLLLILHRWAGLSIALALVVTGLTGAILPYQRELSQWLAADIWQVEPPAPATATLSGLELARRVEAETGGVVSYIPLAPAADRAQAIFVSARPGGPPLGYDEVFVDPYSGQIRARVTYGDLRDGTVNWMPFLVRFHYSLAAGEWGRFLMGVAALLWFGVALIGIVLSLPKGLGERGFWRRWRPAWAVRRDRGTTVLTHDLHRATGLWLWPVMLVFAWSAVAFNLDQVHGPVQRFFGAEGLYRPVENLSPAAGQAMSWEEAVAHGERLMAHEAERGGFHVHSPEALSLAPYANAMGYYARTSLDEPSEHGSTVVWFDQASGVPLGFGRPYGRTGADAVDKAVRVLHTADGLGWPYRVFVSLFGLLTAGMAGVGVVLWARRSRRLPTAAPALS
jgi:uncharacterized iron-regulated membrane protein